MPTPLLDTTFTLCGALAMELATPASVAHRLPRDQAGALARGMASDLARLDARVQMLWMSTVGSHYDPVELLRPGWPLLAEIDHLGARAPGQDHAQVIAFAAHDGALPGLLTPADDYLGGPLRVLPFVLRGEAETIAQVKDNFERDLFEHGMAGAQTALLAQDAFALKIEHARYLTLHDLCAMTALHYEHAGLAALWPLIETVLLSPERDLCLDAPPEPLLRWHQGEMQMLELTPPQWHARYAVGLDVSAAQRLHSHFKARQRQLISVLEAHAMSVRMAPLTDFKPS